MSSQVADNELQEPFELLDLPGFPQTPKMHLNPINHVLDAEMLNSESSKADSDLEAQSETRNTASSRSTAPQTPHTHKKLHNLSRDDRVRV